MHFELVAIRVKSKHSANKHISANISYSCVLAVNRISRYLKHPLIIWQQLLESKTTIHRKTPGTKMENSKHRTMVSNAE